MLHQEIISPQPPLAASFSDLPAHQSTKDKKLIAAIFSSHQMGSLSLIYGLFWINLPSETADLQKNIQSNGALAV
jgi:hypothetical protein